MNTTSSSINDYLQWYLGNPETNWHYTNAVKFQGMIPNLCLGETPLDDLAAIHAQLPALVFAFLRDNRYAEVTIIERELPNCYEHMFAICGMVFMLDSVSSLNDFNDSRHGV